jgi:hypothetical protein
MVNHGTTKNNAETHQSLAAATEEIQSIGKCCGMPGKG